MSVDRRTKKGYDISVVNRSRQRLPLAFFRRSAEATFRELGFTRIALGIVFTGQREMRGWARAHHRHRAKRPTSVLAFSYTRSLRNPRRIHLLPLVGDIALCLPVIRQEARLLHVPFRAHLVSLLVHAMVHLAGYSHHTFRQAAEMELLEKKILRKLGFC